jgi:ectoine hydroxylase-related dioxygenase (phytanoyl-CoA dioxygenase family)
VVVALPLGDVSHEMGPTEMCPGYKRRFYHGWRCHERSIRLASTAGTVVIFDYKTLHRGPANEAADERPMVSMVFSKMFFLNAEAVINRGISLVQTLHQRRYWEQWTWHPRTVDEQFVV